MEYFWWLYLATRLDEIKHVFHFTTAIGLATAVVCVVIIGIITISIHTSYSDDEEEEAKGLATFTPYRTKLYRAMVVAISVAVFSGLSGALTPSKKDVVFIASGVGVVEATKALAGSSIAKKSVSIIEAWLDKELMILEKDNPDRR